MICLVRIVSALLNRNFKPLASRQSCTAPGCRERSSEHVVRKAGQQCRCMNNLTIDAVEFVIRFSRVRPHCVENSAKHQVPVSCGTSEEAGRSATWQALKRQVSRISNGPSYELSALIVKAGGEAQLHGAIICVFLQW